MNRPSTSIHQEVSLTFRRVTKILLAFLIFNLLLTLLAIVLRDTFASGVYGTVLTRDIVFLFGGLLLFVLHRQIQEGKRWAWQRLRFISIAAPIGAIIFLFTTHGLPTWMIFAQVLVALLYVSVAILLNQEHIHAHFPKPESK